MTIRPRFCRQTLQAAVLLLIALGLFVPARANDALFPALPSAAKQISFQGNYFVINGKPQLLLSGEMHYVRIPRALWRDRLLRAKRMGLNCIQTYVMWNAQEPREGHFDFSGNRDLDAWLTLIQQLGMYATVRVGPYVCAEWDFGGTPAWLAAKPGMQIRNDYPPYLQAVDRLFEHIFPILDKHQIDHGGSLVLVQLENEYPDGWGTEGNAYLRHLYTKARALGLEIPCFFSGLHHSGDPAGDTPFGERAYPWYVTEFWIPWGGNWGWTTERLYPAVHATWKILAFGGAGYDYYVVHGGTSFGYTRDDQYGTDYDFLAPIGQAGQIRPGYGPLKRIAWFARTYNAVLASAHDGAGRVTGVNPALQCSVRTSPHGTLVFLDNKTSKPLDTGIDLSAIQQRKSSMQNPLLVPPGEMRAIPVAIPWTRNVTFAYLATNVFVQRDFGARTVVVCYGRAGERGEIALQYRRSPASLPAAPWQWNGESQLAHLTFTYPAGETIGQYTAPSGDGKQLLLLVENSELADRTWVTDTAIICGPHYVGDHDALEFPLAGGQATIFSHAGQRTVVARTAPARPAPPLTTWHTRDAAAEAAVDYNDRDWLTSAQPQSMVTYHGFMNSYGWYRTTFRSETDGEMPLTFLAAADDLRVFVNGQYVGDTHDTLHIPLRQGMNTLAILAYNHGRNKLFEYIGPIGMSNDKGIYGPVMLGGEKTLAVVTTFKTSMNDAGPETAATYAAMDYDDQAWQQVSPAPDLMQHHLGYAWYRASIDLPDVPQAAILQLDGIDDHAWAYVNGQLVGLHDDWQTPGRFLLAPTPLRPGRNVIAVCVQNRVAAGGLTGAVRLVSYRGGRPLTNWRFQGSEAGIAETPLSGDALNWGSLLRQRWEAAPQPAHRPTLWRTDVAYAPARHLHETFMLCPRGLSRGVVWLNGHNLGRYDNGDVRLFVPECWLTAHNTLLIFDEEGNAAANVHLEYAEQWQSL
jgi:beta-galactosidase